MQPNQIEKRTSKLGKASLLIAITVFSLVVLSVVAIVVMLELGNKSNSVAIGISMIGWVLAPGGHLVGLVLGIIDICRAGSKKLVPAIGIAGNAILGGIGFAVLIYVLSLLIQSLGAFR